MYFSLIPDLKYDRKPISYPFSESDYVLTKNFFRRYQANPDIFDYSVFYNKYAVVDGERLETIADKAYGSPFYDWVVVLTNNFINPQFAFPLDPFTLRLYVEEKYGMDEAYSGVHHYETIETNSGIVIDAEHAVALKGGLVVDESFYNGTFTYWNGTGYTSVPGNTVSKPVSNYEYEEVENEKLREIFILKPRVFDRFVEEFKTKNLYTKSSSFITKSIKQTRI